MQTIFKRCPECGGILIPDDKHGQVLIYACEGCKSLHEAGKPLYTYQPVFIAPFAADLLEIK